MFGGRIPSTGGDGDESQQGTDVKETSTSGFVNLSEEFDGLSSDLDRTPDRP